MSWKRGVEKDKKYLDLQIKMVENGMNGREESMWTIIGNDILVYVADPNLLGLRLRYLLMHATPNHDIFFHIDASGCY